MVIEETVETWKDRQAAQDFALEKGWRVVFEKVLCRGYIGVIGGLCDGLV